MNVRDRFTQTLKGGNPDRVPLMLKAFRDITDRKQIDAIRDPAQRELAARACEQSVSFMTWPSSINRWLVTPSQFIRHAAREEHNGNITTTSEIKTPRGNLTAIATRNRLTKTSWVVKYPVESLDDIEKIRSIPWELPGNLGPPDLSQLPPNFYERSLLKTSVSSPFTCVAGMMPYQYFLELCAAELDLIKELTAICRERVLSIMDVVLAEKSIDYVWVGGCEWITPPMGSPRLYDELVQNFEKDIIARIHEASAFCHVHCHGNVRSSLELVIERGADLFEPVEPPPDGDIEFAEAKELAAGRITLAGNIEARILEYESLEVVEEATRRAFDGSKQRMALTESAGPIHEMTPALIRNYHCVIDVWEELSPL